MELVEFLRAVVTAKSGWFCLAHATISSKEEEIEKSWSEEFFSWPDEIPTIINRIHSLKDNHEVYFSPYLFSEQNSKKEHAIAGKTIVADLDEANILTISLKPTILVETSAGRHQGYWILREELDRDEHETLSKRLTYSIPRCDRTGWFLGKKVRVPETFNNKYKSGPQYIRIVESNGRIYNNQELQEIASAEELYGKDVKLDLHEEDLDWVEEALKQTDGPNEMLARIRTSIPTVVARYNIQQKDRSAALWALYMALFRAGLPKEKVFFIAYHSVNNKFKELRFGGLRELGKDVLRAELATKIQMPDIKDKINNARKLGENVNERNAYIAKIIRDYLDKLGSFVHCVDDSAWYIRGDTGRPISISSRSQHLLNMLDNLFGINASEKESSYVNHSLQSMVSELPVMGKVATLSNYDHELRTLVVHTGRKDVLVVKPDGITRQTNGFGGLVFPWTSASTVISPHYRALDKPWEDELFDDCLNNVLTIQKEDAKAILKVWLISVLMRDGLSSRPILALFGQPGCLSEDTILEIKRGEHSARTIKLKDAYNRFYNRWNPEIPTRIKSVKDGEVKWREIKSFIKSGQKETFEVKIQGHDPFRVTKDHRFLTSHGYKRLEELKVGDTVIVQGDRFVTTGRAASWRKEVSVKYHPYARMKMVNGYGPYGYIYEYRAVVEAKLNGMSLDTFIYICNTSEEETKNLQFIPENSVIHHKDENPFNNSFDNLEVVTKTVHDKKHGIWNQQNFGHYSGMWSIKEGIIESITPFGMEETYDIEMEDEEAPNFLVNGVVVHNSGKSTLFRRIYALIYGKEKGLNSVTREEDFDHAMAVDPLVVLDNVDTYAKWLPDRLAATVAPTEITKRRLFTDTDTIVLRRQALLGITAHNPKFSREDVTDRLLLFTFERLEKFKPENVILERISNMRNALWGAILQDVQKVLATDVPRTGYPQFRIEDFAQFGYWIATALNVQKEFYRGIETIRGSQRSFNLEEDTIIVDAIERLVSQEAVVEMSAGSLWHKLRRYSRDEKSFDKKYINAVSLGRKMWTLIDSLREMYNVEWTIKKGVRVWTISKMLEVEVGTNGTTQTVG